VSVLIFLCQINIISCFLFNIRLCIPVVLLSSGTVCMCAYKICLSNPIRSASEGDSSNSIGWAHLLCVYHWLHHFVVQHDVIPHCCPRQLSWTVAVRTSTCVHKLEQRLDLMYSKVPSKVFAPRVSCGSVDIEGCTVCSLVHVYTNWYRGWIYVYSCKPVQSIVCAPRVLTKIT
jgi:hypothetical protein